MNNIKKTFELIIQCTRTPVSTILKKKFKSPFSALNIKHQHKPVVIDTVYSNAPAIDNGSTSMQIFISTEILVTNVCSMKYNKEFVDTLEDNIRKRGAMNKLISDRAMVKLVNGSKISLELCLLMIGRENLISNIKTLLREESKLLKEELIFFLIELELLYVHGF